MPMHVPLTRRAAALVAAVAVWAGPTNLRAAEAPGPVPALEAKKFEALAWREVGPYRGGRSAAVAGVEDQPRTFYFGATGGGVWKSVDGGTSWKNVSDGFFGGSIGAVAVAPSDPNVVWVGGGEKTVRGNVSHGSGVWRSLDAGKTWKAAGLADSRHVARLRVDPRDPDRAYAAVLGNLFQDSPTRGVFRTLDGGKTWQRVLHVNDAAGAVDLTIDPSNARVLYASLWRVRRTPWSLSSGGEGSGLWKSVDGGDTWSELTRKKGLPTGTVGIIGVAVSPGRPENLYALIEAEDGGLFRSTDGGETWSRTSDDRQLRQRAWYFSRLAADPRDADSVYVLNVAFHHSRDGGKSFETIETPHGDHHDLWISDRDPLRMIHASDGGASVSFDGGRTWSRQDNQPTAQIYRLATDDRFPFRLYGAQQDNTTVRIASRSDAAGIGARDWEPTAGGESGHVVPDPADPEVVYGGSYGGYLTRRDHRTRQERQIDVWPDNPMGWAAGDLRYRFQWNFPVFFSPHNEDALYAAGNVLFMSEDEGQSWKAVSPDLTRNDKATQGPSGGPITKDNTSVEYFGTIFAALESPFEPGAFWAGSDDGLVHLSRDYGANWQNVTPQGLPKWATINSLEAHPTVRTGLYLAATAYKTGDFAPYLFKTLDYGKTWTKITSGIDREHFTRVLRADPERPGLLYAGTESGIYVSFDDGGRWQQLQLGLPLVPVTDLAIRDGALVAATQGRGFWILDDLAVLRQLAAKALAEDLHVFTPGTTVRTAPRGSSETPPGEGKNPPDGAAIYYWLKSPAPDVAVTLEILTADGQSIRTFERTVESAGSAAKPQAGEPTKGKEKGEAQPEPTAEAGLNRFVWDLRYPPPTKLPGAVFWGGEPTGPRVLPGEYLVRLTVGGDSTTTQLRVVADPRSTASGEALAAQFEFLRAIRDLLDHIHRSLVELRSVRGQLEALAGRLGAEGPQAAVATAARKLAEELSVAERPLVEARSMSPQDPLNFPIRLNDKLAALASAVGGTLERPTNQAEAVRQELSAAAEAALGQLHRLLAENLPALERLAAESGVPFVSRLVRNDQAAEEKKP